MYSLEEQVMCCAWALAYENSGESQRKFEEKYGRSPPSRSQINYWKLKLLETGSLSKDRPRTGRPVTASGDDSLELVQEEVHENPQSSIRQIARDKEISPSSVFRCLHKSGMKPYKASCCQLLSDGDEDKRLEFCEIMIDRFRVDFSWSRKIVFSDECNFYLSGSINKHNTHYWSAENPHWKLQSKTHATRYLTVWAAIGWNGLIGLDISEQTMTGDRYCEILTEHVVPYFSRNRSSHYQQDGASSHYAVKVREVLDSKLNGRWIGRRGPIEWPARSPDLTPCDFWYWPYLKSLVFANNIRYETLHSLRSAIEEKINGIPLRMYRDTLRDFEKRVHLCHESGGNVFE